MSMFWLQSKTHLTIIIFLAALTHNMILSKTFRSDPTWRCKSDSTSHLITYPRQRNSLSVLTSLLAAGQDSQLCQTQPPHPTLTQLGSPFSPRSFPTLFPMTKNSNPSLPLSATFCVSSEGSCCVLEMTGLNKNTQSCSVGRFYWTVFFYQDQDHLPTARHMRQDRSATWMFRSVLSK